jgi:hypothetical protein
LQDGIAIFLFEAEPLGLEDLVIQFETDGHRRFTLLFWGF